MKFHVLFKYQNRPSCWLFGTVPSGVVTPPAIVEGSSEDSSPTVSDPIPGVSGPLLSSSSTIANSPLDRNSDMASLLMVRNAVFQPRSLYVFASDCEVM